MVSMGLAVDPSVGQDVGGQPACMYETAKAPFARAALQMGARLTQTLARHSASPTRKGRPTRTLRSSAARDEVAARFDWDAQPGFADDA